MPRKKRLTNKVARIENFFVEHAQYILNVREQKIILHLAANLNLEKENFHEQTVPVKELEQMLKRSDTKWGGIYQEMVDFADRISGKKIKFPSDVLLNGKQLPGFIPWFAGITPCYNESDEVCLKFRFNSDLKPFLLKLNQYVRINLSEIAKLDSFYPIRLYQIFKSNLAKQGKYNKIATKTYDLKDLRELLGAKKKYEEFKYFNRDILSKAKKDINQHTQIYVRYETLRTKRKITHIKFIFCDKKDYKEYKQLSLFDSDPVSNPHNSPEKRKQRKGTFDFEKFKKEFPLVYKQKRKEAFSFYNKMKNVQDREIRINESIKSLCMVWYMEYI